jgi:hypothetical protein
MAANTAHNRALVLMGKSSEVYRAANLCGDWSCVVAEWTFAAAAPTRRSRSLRNNSSDFTALTVDLWGLRNVKPISSTE